MSALQIDAEFFPMNLRDLDSVAALEASLQVFPWSRGNFADSLASGYDAWILSCDGVPSGYAVVMNVLDEAHLLDIGIVGELQGRGLGKRFLDWLAEGAKTRGARDFYLEVRPSNAAALRLYARSGFVEIGRRRGYYPAAGGREDAIVMRRAL